MNTTRVNKDNWFHHLRCTDVTKIPIYNNLEQVGDEPGMEGDVILRRDTQEFCFHDGNTWICMKAGGEDVTLTDACSTGVSLVFGDGMGPALFIKGLTQSNGIVLTDNGAGCVNIATAITLANACGTGVNLVADGTGPDLLVKGLSASDGIVLSDDGSCVNIATAITLANACGTGVNLVADGTGPNLLIKGLIPGDGITLSGDGSCVIITSSEPSSSVTLDNACGTGVTLVAKSDGPNLKIKGLVEGVGITLRDDASCVTIETECCPCNPTPLTQADVDGSGLITLPLTASQRNYCLAENITGDILISGDNITVDGNDRLLTGRVDIDATDAIFKNGKVKPPAPVDSPPSSPPDPVLAAIEITASGVNAQILNCLVECEDTTAAGVAGRTGISSAGEKTIIERCNVTAGKGGDGSGGGAGGDGADGIKISGDNGSIVNSRATAGDGGGGSGVSAGGDGGDGIEISGGSGSIDNSTATGGAGGDAVIFTTGDGGNGGDGIEISGDNGSIDNSTATGGAGGSGGGVAGTGGDGIEISGDNSSIDNSTVTGGAGGITGLAFAVGGVGGNGIEITSDNGSIDNSIVIGGNGGGGVSSFSSGGDGGNGIEISGDNGSINNSTATGGDGDTSGPDRTGGDGGNGIEISGDNGSIDNSTATGGNGTKNFSSPSIAGSGGDGIEVSGSNGSINTSTAIGGAGGAGVIGTTVGAGGNGIEVADTSDTIIIKSCCVVDGGTGANGTSAPGGDGGNGIVVRGGSPTDAQNIQICECKINNVGAAGSGTVPGTPGVGILIEDGVLCVQVLSNRVTCCPGIGIDNNAGAEAAFGNNASTFNGTNYSGVSLIASLTGSPAPTYWENVTE